MLLYSLFDRFPCFLHVDFTVRAKNFVDYEAGVLFSRIDRAAVESIFPIELFAYGINISVSYLILTFWQTLSDLRR